MTGAGEQPAKPRWPVAETLRARVVPPRAEVRGQHRASPSRHPVRDGAPEDEQDRHRDHRRPAMTRLELRVAAPVSDDEERQREREQRVAEQRDGQLPVRAAGTALAQTVENLGPVRAPGRYGVRPSRGHRHLASTRGDASATLRSKDRGRRRDRGYVVVEEFSSSGDRRGGFVARDEALEAWGYTHRTGVPADDARDDDGGALGLTSSGVLRRRRRRVAATGRACGVRRGDRAGASGASVESATSTYGRARLPWTKVMGSPSGTSALRL